MQQIQLVVNSSGILDRKQTLFLACSDSTYQKKQCIMLTLDASPYIDVSWIYSSTGYEHGFIKKKVCYVFPWQGELYCESHNNQ